MATPDGAEPALDAKPASAGFGDLRGSIQSDL